MRALPKHQHKRENQLSLPISPQQRMIIEHLAEQQQRSLASMLRVLLTEAIQNLQRRGAA